METIIRWWATTTSRSFVNYPDLHSIFVATNNYLVWQVVNPLPWSSGFLYIFYDALSKLFLYERMVLPHNLFILMKSLQQSLQTSLTKLAVVWQGHQVASISEYNIPLKVLKYRIIHSNNTKDFKLQRDFRRSSNVWAMSESSRRMWVIREVDKWDCSGSLREPIQVLYWWPLDQSFLFTPFR